MEVANYYTASIMQVAGSHTDEGAVRRHVDDLVKRVFLWCAAHGVQLADLRLDGPVFLGPPTFVITGQPNFNFKDGPT